MNKDIYQVKLIYTDASNKIERMPYRVMQFHKDTNLLQLAHHILKNFSFKLTEPFGFYTDMVNWHKSEHKFELFEDDPKTNTLKNTYIDDFFDHQKEYILIYDYLEEYRFLIIYDKMVPERTGINYPDLIESMGETKAENEAVKLLDDDEDLPKYGAKKNSGSFKDEFDDYGDDEIDKLSSIDGEDDDDENGGDDFGLDEYESDGKEEDLK